MPLGETAPHVVIVEDNVETNNLLRDWLKLKFAVTCFLDAESTLRLLPPNELEMVFILDYNMPGDNGLTLKRKLTDRFPKAKYLLMSGLFEEKLVAEANKAGFDAILPKPFAMPTVTKRINDLLGLTSRQSLMDMVKNQSEESA